MSENSENQYEIFRLDVAEYKTLLTEKYKNRKAYVKPKIKEIYSFIPGTIDNIILKKGDNVAKGDVILILEAMKMRNKILSPIDGVIKEILVKKGDIVPKNKLLVTLD